MSLRQEAVRLALSRTVRKIDRPHDSLGNPLPVSEYFGSLVFGLDQMKEKLSTESFNRLMELVEKGRPLDRDVANEIGVVVKDWAISTGATHFCHYFQPMTGLTAEKHDALIDIKISERGQTQVLERLTGSSFLQSEPDASSFPSGGMRSTFEARGYTAWDPTSPLFIVENLNGKTLCVPSAFIGYHGEALDMKTPLLRSAHAITREATRFLKLLGDVDIKAVRTTLGIEQEYFLIDRSFYALRPDLVMTGRTLLGRSSTRGQQFEDHYFGSIPARVLAFMQELEQEMFKLGVPLKTRHNEVAPSQFEVAPIFEDSNVATDHNSLLMDMMRRVALRHNLVCLIHEKPFAGINGSGKHSNWSLSTTKGENLLDPGKTPHQNLRFLAVLSVVLKAVYEQSAVLRAGIASPGNDHRLGANEAPPAIISVFLGDTLSRICDKIEKGEVIQESTSDAMIHLGVASLPQVAKDNTDRNRTSPFAFTGNKFEFRAVGGSANVAVPISILNAAVANAFKEVSDKLESKLSSGNRDEVVLGVVREILKETRSIRFEGNNYDMSWVKEAEKRGLPHLRNTAEALDVLKDEKKTKFLIDSKVLSREELAARHHIMVERYNKQLDMEAATLLEIVDTCCLPVAENELRRLGEVNAIVGKTAGEYSKDREATYGKLYSSICEARSKVEKDLAATQKIEDEFKRSHAYATKVVPAVHELRALVDELEGQTPDSEWPLPKYREILFLN